MILRSGWRLRVTHETHFDYDEPARASYNELRISPRTEVNQTTLETRVTTLPPAPQFSYVDYWGTHVIAFNVDRAHDALSVIGHALVDTTRAKEPGDCRWSDVADASETMADHLSHHLYTNPGSDLRDIALGLRSKSPLETALRVLAASHSSLTYQRGVTSVHTSANEAYSDGAGVCQDYAHLAIALGRSAGLPCRYVSGYFHPEEDASVGEEVPGQSHAWVELWTGSWWGYDPTNDCPVGERHVAVGRGRDYGDVPPVKGIYAGNAENAMRVVVRITRTQ